MSVTFAAKTDGDRPSVNFANVAAIAVLEAMALGSHWGGECTIAEARRGVIRARNTKIDGLTFKGHAFGRVVSGGLDLDGLNRRIDDFSKMVEIGAKSGAKSIYWG